MGVLGIGESKGKCALRYALSSIDFCMGLGKGTAVPVYRVHLLALGTGWAWGRLGCGLDPLRLFFAISIDFQLHVLSHLFYYCWMWNVKYEW
jgi:hypothetical protein